MEKTLKENPYDSAGLFSRMFFWWFNEFAMIGLKRKFEEKDLCKDSKDDDSEYLGNLLQKACNVELSKKNPSLLKSIIRVLGPKCALWYIISLFQECFVFIFQAYLIGIVIDYFEYKHEEKKLFAYLSAVGICICLLLHIIIFHTYVFTTCRFGMQIISAISNVIYKKSLKLSHASLGKSHIGQIVNLLSSDVVKINLDPLLFSGSLRRNIDPFDKHDDETLWKVLVEVQLKKAVQNLEGGLNAELSERGSNFSVGQRQLICLARAIIHRNKILILDEATAFIDKETDYIIQKTIREKFASSTILTIAHRLQTIMDSDRIMVLRDGKIEEFDEPYILLQNTNGIFYNMAKKAGKDITKQVQITAKEMHFETRNENPKRTKEQTDLKFSDTVNIEEYESGNHIMCIGESSPQREYFCEETKM